LKSIAVIGLGYIGLPTAAMFASRGLHVVGVDINEASVRTINRGDIHIVEPELDVIVRATVNQGRLRATTQVEAADAFIIAVPTPFKDGNEPDLAFVEAAVRSIAPVLKKGDLIILESTSPVGTTEKMAQWLSAARADLAFPGPSGEAGDVNLAYCPERVLPGKIVRELVSNDRIIGGMTTACAQRASALYKVFVEGTCIETDVRTAEMCKLTENSFRDVNIAFANELSVICDKLGIDVWELIRLANRHPRVSILEPGPGVGGHCIAVDPWFIVSAAPAEARLIRTARVVNDDKPAWVMDKVTAAIDRCLQTGARRSREEITVACLGLAFKPDIDDLRESPSARIAQDIAASHAGPVLAVEPNIEAMPSDWTPKLRLVPLEEALRVANIVVILVGHREFKALPPAAYDGRIVVDVKGICA
jgi:UDP-N-acetyl-D-mannosaminuronic acid dehydrogenase